VGKTLFPGSQPINRCGCPLVVLPFDRRPVTKYKVMRKMRLQFIVGGGGGSGEDGRQAGRQAGSRAAATATANWRQHTVKEEREGEGRASNWPEN
jgi:hypothetical protein